MASHPILVLRNTVRSYAWGSHTAIADLLGAPSPTAEPQAEVWMGAHPNAPSRVVTDEGEIPLDVWIARDPEVILGSRVAACFGGKLPFLFKVLAVERPLSIQAHPDLEQARAGFARENASGIPLDDPRRSYKDENPKPELICALSSFQALNRFRGPGEIAANFESLDVPELSEMVASLGADSGEEAVARFFRSLMTLAPDIRKSALERASINAADRVDDDPAWSWVRRLADLYPGDVGALAPLFLNFVTLEPGEAMYLRPGELHCYLEGTAVEIMGNSDNVLRGGLTTKHVDVEELLATLSFSAGAVDRLTPVKAASGEDQYSAPAEEFALSVHRVEAGVTYGIDCDRGAEILFCSEGSARVHSRGGGVTSLGRGESAFVPAEVQRYNVEGHGALYRATAGIRGDLL